MIDIIDHALHLPSTLAMLTATEPPPPLIRNIYLKMYVCDLFISHRNTQSELVLQPCIDYFDLIECAHRARALLRSTATEPHLPHATIS